MFFFTFDLFTLIIGGAIVLAVLWGISTINGFKRREIKIEEALSGIEVALTKRYDMLTKLLDTAKGFMEHESDLFSRVVSLRRPPVRRGGELPGTALQRGIPGTAAGHPGRRGASPGRPAAI